MVRFREAVYCIVVVCVGLSVGCTGKPAPIEVPDIDPESTAIAVIDQLDSDGDDKLSRDELTACPGMLHSLRRYDQDGDEHVSSKEIASRIREWYGEGIGIFTVGCIVTFDGRPLSQAEVKLTPETFFGDAIKPASGITRDGGRAMLTIGAGDLPEELRGVRGVNAGLYRVEITHPSVKIPAKYNSNTTLGRDVSQADQVRGLRFELTSGS